MNYYFELDCDMVFWFVMVAIANVEQLLGARILESTLFPYISPLYSF